MTFDSPFFNSGGASFNDPIGNPGTRIGIFDPNGAIAADVHSPNNVAGPLAGGTDQAFGNGFMEVIFPADVQRVGLWVTHGTFTMFLKDSNNTNLTTGDVSVTGSAGQFIGIQRDTPDVRGITMGFPESFTFDDFTYATDAVPEPANAIVVTLAVGAAPRPTIIPQSRSNSDGSARQIDLEKMRERPMCYVRSAAPSCAFAAAMAR